MQYNYIKYRFFFFTSLCIHNDNVIWNYTTIVLILYLDCSHLVSPNRGVEGYIRLANRKDSWHPSPTLSINQKQLKHKRKLSKILIKPNRKQFAQICTSSSCGGGVCSIVYIMPGPYSAKIVEQKSRRLK